MALFDVGTIEEFEIVLAGTQRCRANDVPIAITDFGTALSNLNCTDIEGPELGFNLARAMDVPPEDIVSVSTNNSDGAGMAVWTIPLGDRGFPTTGGNFAVLSTGGASNANLPDGTLAGAQLAGLNTPQGQDLVQLGLTLRVPAGRTCLKFSFQFLTEEYPNFVGSEYNDAFIAEIGASTFTIIGNQVIAPNNFAFDPLDGSVLDLSSSLPFHSDGAATVYGGATNALTAGVQVAPGSELSITLSVMDLFDSIFDSAVFVDNFRWTSEVGAQCPSGIQSAPTAPTWQSATPLSESQVQLNWNDNSGDENGFVIYRYGASASTQAGSVGPNVTTFSDSGLAGGVHYIYSLVAHNGSGFTLAPDTITAITPGGAPAPPVLESVVGISTSQVRLTWRDNSPNEAGFQVFRFDPLNPGAGYTGLGLVPPNTTSMTDSGLAPGNTYFYWVVAQSADGLFNGFSPAIFSGTTFTASPDPLAPRLTGGVTVSGSQIRINWTDNTGNESGFRVQRWNGASWQLIATLGANATTYQDSGLAGGIAYQYQVSAFGSGFEKFSPASISVTTAGSWPAPPTPTSAYGLSTSSIRVNWQDNSSNETGFKLIRTDSVTGASTQIDLPAGTTTYQDTGLVAGRYYYYWLWALGSQGNGYASTIIPANTYAP
jgi:hypothetical protein